MKNLKKKKGISLIVLVITIIVMIILAAAIILSLSNSGIIGKANKAKQDSDVANLKEYVNVLQAEWELMDPDERTNTGVESSIEYVNAKLAQKGYTDKTYSADGEIYTDLPESSKDAISKGLKIGDKVNYVVRAGNTYEPEYEKTGSTDNTPIWSQTNLTWIYIGVGDDGKLLISPDIQNGVPTAQVTLYGKNGWVYGSEELNKICDELYTVTGKGKARSMNIDDVNRLLGYTGEKGSYSDASGKRIPTLNPKTIGEIAEEIGYTLSNFYFSVRLPETDKTVGEYESNYYSINKSDDVGKIKYLENIKYVYPSNDSYWLASTCVYAMFKDNYASLDVFSVISSKVTSNNLVYSYSSVAENGHTDNVRAVVSLEANIEKSIDNGNVVWNFPS